MCGRTAAEHEYGHRKKKKQCVSAAKIEYRHMFMIIRNTVTGKEEALFMIIMNTATRSRRSNLYANHEYGHMKEKKQ
jgi:hypothetical protein